MQGLAVGNFAGQFGNASKLNIFGGYTGTEVGGSGIVLAGSGDSIVGCYLGVDPTGLSAAPNDFAGAFVTGSNATVGGTTPSARNVISGNDPPSTDDPGTSGIRVADSSGDLIAGNFIGTDATGSSPLPNPYGIQLFDGSDVTVGDGRGRGQPDLRKHHRDQRRAAQSRKFLAPSQRFRDPGKPDRRGGQRHDAPPNTADGIDLATDDSTVGGTVVGAGNVISDNSGTGLVIEDDFSLGNATVARSTGTLVEGNFIGTDATGTLAIGNGVGGIFVYSVGDDTIGGTAAGAANIIANNNSAGISIDGASFLAIPGQSEAPGADTITRNSIFANGSGISAALAGPAITSVTSSGGSTVVDGTVSGTPNTAYTVEFYKTPPSDSGYSEGQTYLMSLVVTTDASGNATLDAANATIPFAFTTGEFLSATATNNTTGATSSFSQTVAQLQLVETASTTAPAPGDPVALTLTVTNPGNTTNANVNGDTGVTLTEFLPPGFDFVSSSAGSYDPASHHRRRSARWPTGRRRRLP